MVFLRKGSVDIEDDDSLVDFFLARDLVTLEAVLMGDEDVIVE